MRRYLQLDICDYRKNVVCQLYDSTSDIIGQAYDVNITSERNGWKELSFSLTSTVKNENLESNLDIEVESETANYRLDFLKADYLIRSIDDTEIDWYIISEPKITHNDYSKTVSVRAGHISQLLKNKNLELEFSSTEGNNVGTPSEFLQIILENTGWEPGVVANFLEDDGVTIKRRTLEASSKTGAFKLITTMCTLFDAKPIFHSESKTVDILPLNPFSMTKDASGNYRRQDYVDGIPEEAGLNNTIELHYGKNVKGVTKTVNTENMITKLYVYGSYGSEVTGLCSIRTCEHREYAFTMPGKTSETEFRFTDNGMVYYFKCTPSNGDRYVWSSLDLFSRSYVWCVAKQEFHIVYHKAETSNPVTISATPEVMKNNVPFILNIQYYRDIGLMTDEQFKRLIIYQRTLPVYYQNATDASTALSDAEYELDKVGNCNSGFLQFEVQSYGTEDGYLVANLKTSSGTNGVVYRTDEGEQRRNYFSWYVAESINDKGISTTDLGGKVLIVHDTNPVTWEFAYLKKVDNLLDDQGKPTHYHYFEHENDPYKVTLWIKRDKVASLSSSDKFYLFCTANFKGTLGTTISQLEGVYDTIEQQTTRQGKRHPVFFIDYNVKGTTLLTDQFDEYAWAYQYTVNDNSLGTLYYNNTKSNTDKKWRQVYFGNSLPAYSTSGQYAGQYFFDMSKRILYAGGTEWIRITPQTGEDHLTSVTYRLYDLCHKRDRYVKGYREKYTRTGTDLTQGDYIYKSEYEEYWTFTVERQPAAEVWIDTQKNYFYVDDDPTHITSVNYAVQENVIVPRPNIIDGLERGTIVLDDSVVQQNNTNAGTKDKDSTTDYRTKSIHVLEDEEYEFNLPVANCVVHLYDKAKQYIKSITLVSKTGTFKTNKASDVTTNLEAYVDGAYYMRLVIPGSGYSSSHYIRLKGYNSKLIVSDKAYKVVTGFTASGKRYGINENMKDFTTAVQAVKDNQTLLQNAQDAIKNLESTILDMDIIIREGTWQDSNYVEGDEDRLYKDAMDNLKEVSKPDTTYDISFLDLYGSNRDIDFGNLNSLNIEWPDICVTWAAHLIDEDLGVSLWGYIDKLTKAYDKPWDTRISVNTKLTLIGQHEFQDVMTHIVDVAKETKAKQTLYARAASLNAHGELLASKITGVLDSYVTTIGSTSSSWESDPNGNLVFNAVDNRSAMMLSGAGLMIANQKDKNGNWIWRTAATGDGIVADSISSGTLMANFIEAYSITADKLSSAVGETLDISSNSALNLFATADGSRPAGSLETAHPTNTESWISIGAKTNDHDAYIAIKSGGEINIESNSKINVQSGGSIIMTAADQISIGTGTLQSLLDEKGSMESSEVQYYLSTSTSTPTGGSWSSTAPAWVDGKYMWTRTKVMVAGQSSPIYMPSENGTCIAGAKGDDGLDGRTVTSIETRYYLHTSPTSEPSAAWNHWQTTMPAYQPNKYYWTWTRTTIAEQDGSNPTTVDVKVSELGVNSAYNESAEAKTLANVIIDGTDYRSTGSFTKFFNKQIENTGVTVSSNDLFLSSTGSMYLCAGEGIFIAASGSSEQTYAAASANVDAQGHKAGFTKTVSGVKTPNNAVVINQSGIAIASQGTISIKSGSKMELESGGSIDISAGTFTINKDYFKVTPNDSGGGSVTIVGDVTATTGYIANWKIEGNTIKSGSNTTFVCLDSGTSGENYAIWAGNASSSSAPFSVTRAGALKSTSGSIGGWTISDYLLSSGNDNSKTYVALNTSTTTNADYVMWAGNSSPTSGNTKFYLKKDGTVKMSGEINALSGSIAGWTIEDGSIHAGSANTYVSFSLAPASFDYVLWGGTESPETDDKFWGISRAGDADFRYLGAHALTCTGTNGYINVGGVESWNTYFYIDGWYGFSAYGNNYWPSILTEIHTDGIRISRENPGDSEYDNPRRYYNQRNTSSYIKLLLRKEGTDQYHTETDLPDNIVDIMVNREQKFYVSKDGNVYAKGSLTAGSFSTTGTISSASVSATGSISGESVSATGTVSSATVSATTISGTNITASSKISTDDLMFTNLRQVTSNAGWKRGYTTLTDTTNITNFSGIPVYNYQLNGETGTTKEHYGILESDVKSKFSKICNDTDSTIDYRELIAIMIHEIKYLLRKVS